MADPQPPTGFQLVTAPVSVAPFNPPRLTVVAPKPPTGFQLVTDDAPKQERPSYQDLAMGALKQTGRLAQGASDVLANVSDKVYGLPSGSSGTLGRAADAIYGLPAGGSEQAMQSSNRTQRIGGYGASAVEMLGGVTGMTSDPLVNPGMATSAVEELSKMGTPISTAAKAAVGELTKGGPITAAKVGVAAAKYGEAVVKLALKALGVGAVYEGYRAVIK